jgi:hypothetical protein
MISDLKWFDLTNFLLSNGVKVICTYTLNFDLSQATDT